MITSLTDFDGGLAKVATATASRFFPELTGDWRVGALAHQRVAESLRLFADGWPTGWIRVVELPGGQRLFAEVGYIPEDLAAAVQSHGLTTNAAAECLRAPRVILVTARQFDLRSDDIRALFAHELCHAITVEIPVHGPEWRACMRAKAQVARRKGDGTLASLLLDDVKRHATADIPYGGPQDMGAYLDAFVARSDAAQARFRITVGAADGTTLDQWLAAWYGSKQGGGT